MSYDLNLFLPSPGLDLTDPSKVEEILESEVDLPGDPARQAEMKRLSADLRRVNPALQGEHAEDCIELSAERYQISIFERSVGVAVPYDENRETVTTVLSEVWTMLETLEKSGGFRTYDPQVSRVLDLKADYDGVLETYVGSAETIRRAQIVRAIDEADRKPWWQFWKR